MVQAMNASTHMVQPLYSRERTSTEGKWAFLVSLLFVFSISADYRIAVAGLLMHPFLLLMPLAIFFTGFHVFRISTRVLAPLLTFFIFFSVASLQNERVFSEIIKVGASVLTFLFFATSVKTEKDFRLISVGIVICGIVIGYLAFQIAPEASTGERLEGVNALEGLGNKNAQSLFTLPALFLSGLLTVTSLRQRNIWLSAFLISGLFFIVVSIFLSANRSGWVGMGIIVLIFFVYFRLSLNLLIIAGILFLFSYLGIDRYASDIVERKQEQTLQGYRSDEGRLLLIRESLRVGFENPWLGVGMDNLHKRMNMAVHRSSVGGGLTDTHFLIGYLFGATGIFTLFFFFFFLKRVVERKGKYRFRGVAEDPWILLAGFVLLFVVRSFFTREILYSPTFVGTMGLLYGYYIMHLRHVGAAK